MPDGISIGVGANASRLGPGLAKAKKQIGGFAKDTEKTLTGALSRGFATSALLGGSVGLVLDRLLDKFDAVAKAAQKANIDPEVFQRQAHAFKLSAVSMEDYVRVLGRMTRSAEEAVTGNKEVAEAFDVLGVSVTEFKALTPDEAILLLADAYAAATDKGRALNAMSKILGRSAQELIPAFANGAAAIREAGAGLKNIATQDDLDRIQEYNDALTTLTENFQGFLIKLMKIPAAIQDVAARGGYLLDRLSGMSDEDAQAKYHKAQSQHLLTGDALERDILQGDMSTEEYNAFRDAIFATRPALQNAEASALYNSPEASLAFRPLVAQGGATLSAPLPANDAVSGTLRKISLDIAKMADTGVVVKESPATY